MANYFLMTRPNTTKSRGLAKVGAYAERTLRLAAGRHVAKFALQTHRNFGSLASWENW
jgi:hypothetical protein